MTTFLSADALRVARTLAGMSQRQAADETSMTQKAIWIAEGGDQLGLSANTKLRAFYEKLGIEFLGTVDLATDRSTGLGARWRLPSQIPLQRSAARAFHTEQAGVAFGAARALLNKRQSEIADLSSVASRKIGLLEAGALVDHASSLRLRSFYEEASVEFLGWGDVTSGLFFGVGVRWREQPPPDKSR